MAIVARDLFTPRVLNETLRNLTIDRLISKGRHVITIINLSNFNFNKFWARGYPIEMKVFHLFIHVGFIWLTSK